MRSVDAHAHVVLPPQDRGSKRFPHTEPVDFIIVGSGAAGGVIAMELSTAGFSVVLMEQGPWRSEAEFVHDEIAVFQQNVLTNNWEQSPNSFRSTPSRRAVRQPAVQYGRLVGGTSTHFSANFWRFKPIDFNEASVCGSIAGTGLVDWPITYDELEPYYTKVDWEIGVAGGPGPFDPPRSRPYPMPPHPPKSTGVLLEIGARKMGWRAFPAPMAITSTFYDGRSPCVQCGHCLGFGCEVRAKSSTLVTVIPKAIASGNCEVRSNAYVRKVETDRHGRVTGVKYFDADGNEQYQMAKAVVICANGAETPRLLLNSGSNLFPHGLANSSGVVGKYLMFNGAGLSFGQFEHEVNAYKGIVATRLVWDTFEVGKELGLYGGGGFDYRLGITPADFPNWALPPNTPTWGREFKREMAYAFNRTVLCYGHTTSLPVASNSILLDPTLKDAWGVPAIRVTYRDHEQDLRLFKYFAEKGEQLLYASGAKRAWQFPVTSQEFSVHLLGTARMGNDPRTSVVDKFHRAHDVRNLFIVDGSSLVTSGRGQPTMTIQALAFRAADHIARFAKANAI